MNNIVVIAPHPDDETLGVGGTLLKEKKLGSKIHWLIITSISSENGWKEKLVSNRRKEIEKVNKKYKFDSCHNLNLPTTKLDTLPISNIVEKIKDVYHVVGDFLDNKNQKIIADYFPKKIDLVVSDMAVNTTGNKNLDSIQTGELSLTAMHFAIGMLRPKGIFLSKIFMGSTFNEIVENAKKNFKESKIFKPPSSRKDSKESFIICKKLR